MLDASGVPQSQKGPNVVSINARVRVTGSAPALGNGTAVIDRSSDLTQDGFGSGSSQHTANGAETGTITTTRVDPALGKVKTVETFTHTVTNVVIPNSPGNAIPPSGVVTRTVVLVRTVVSTGAQYISNYHEVATFNGTVTFAIAVTRNGVTFDCILDPLVGLRCD